ncbi:protein ASPARTIC PROTEASE IN GUARD CELL 1-like [Phragmites australis]|uniref:protein ASPARTIC PROTEASE IN GUARD CELL 1-like n=1 Tax=Phragmites australis TaxID=29695 RepID=UPI002D77D811|nr:protein ASPARTIC PROTEASE IN GUARD CELL 1-like [Phragmites australis]
MLDRPLRSRRRRAKHRNDVIPAFHPPPSSLQSAAAALEKPHHLPPYIRSYSLTAPLSSIPLPTNHTSAMQPPALLPLLLLVAALAVSRHHSRAAAAAATETLDVAASLSRARAALSTDAISLHQSAAEASSIWKHSGSRKDSGLMLWLHSRDFLPQEQGQHQSYRSLVLSRLRRDEARAAAVSARAALAADGVTRLDLRPANESAVFAASAAAIQGPVVSGVGQGSGEYFSRVGVGSPARQLYMVLDTGSDVTWVQCQPCADCYQQSDPVFDPSLSTSYTAVSCDSPRCRDLDAAACRNSTGACLYEVAYGDGSYTVGDFATEMLTLGDSQPVSNVAIGCGHDNEGLFVGAAGLLALGGGPLSFPSQISATTFSYCLVDRDSPSASTLQFGDGGGDPDVVTAPLLRSPRTNTFYYVGLSGISVGGQELSIPSSAFAMDASGAGGVIVDSGTAVTRLQSSAYAALRDAFVSGTSSLARTSGVSLFDTCYDLSDRTSVEVPAVALRFEGGGTLRLPAKNYLIPVDGAGTYCLAFAPTNAAVSIIGNVQQQGTRVSFDTAKGTVGFTPNKC